MHEHNLKDQLEKEAQLLVQESEQEAQPVGHVTTPKLTSVISSGPIGKAAVMQDYSEDSHLAAEIGWKNVPMDALPSQGMFYVPGTQVAIRAASVGEIRHWSTIDDNDLLSADDMLNFIIEKCCRIKIPGKPGSYKDIKEIDRFFLIFAIRDYTFKNGENRLYVTVSDDDGVEQKIEVTKDSLDYFNPDEKLMNYFKADEQCFDIVMKNGEQFKVYLPSLGVMMFIKNYITNKQKAGQNFDKTFIKYAPFTFLDWKILNQTAYEKAAQDSFTWSIQRISVIDKIVQLLSSSVTSSIKYQTASGGEGSAPLNFPGGIKSLFLISDIFGELV